MKQFALNVESCQMFINLKVHQSQPKLPAAGRPMLSNMIAVKFSRGNKKLSYKLDHGTDIMWKEFDLLKTRYKLNSTEALPKQLYEALVG